ncbi:MAG: translation elongation factor Ts [Gammaproteobacteria bacterium]|jgi:elongation factor Ts
MTIVINAGLVKTLRDKTNVSMMECKHALQKTNGNIEEAIDLLRKSGIAAAVKKQSRVAAEGLVVLSSNKDKTQVAILEINCETDFVAKNSKLLDFANKVVNLILATKIFELDNLIQQKLNNQETVEEARLTLVSQLGENIVLRRIDLCTAEQGQVLGSYVHGGGVGLPAKIVSVICLEGGNADLARDIAMHAAAMRPEYITIVDVPAARLKKEEEIFMEQTKLNNSDKPEDILKKIVAGRVAKFFKEITLLDQVFVKDSEITIAKLLAKNNAKVIKMLRLEVGEGIEKK